MMRRLLICIADFDQRRFTPRACDDLEAAKRATYGFRLSQLLSQEQGPMTQFADGQRVASASRPRTPSLMVSPMMKR